MEVHKMQQRLDSVGAALTSYLGPPEERVKLEAIDEQTVEVGLHMAAKCQKIYKPPLPPSQEVHVWNVRKKIYKGLLQRLDGRCHNESNLIKKAWRFEVTNPCDLLLPMLGCRQILQKLPLGNEKVG